MPRIPSRDKIAKRFWAKVDKTNNCWNWMGALRRGGYGIIGIDGKTIAAHRLSWELHFGRIKGGLFVLHHCDNRRCVNPQHLFLGTQKDNLQDAARKGRVWRARGKNNGGTVWTNKQLLEIYRRYIVGGISQAQLAREYGVKPSAIYRVIRKKLRSH